VLRDAAGGRGLVPSAPPRKDSPHPPPTSTPPALRACAIHCLASRAASTGYTSDSRPLVRTSSGSAACELASFPTLTSSAGHGTTRPLFPAARLRFPFHGRAARMLKS